MKFPVAAPCLDLGSFVRVFFFNIVLKLFWRNAKFDNQLVLNVNLHKIVLKNARPSPVPSMLAKKNDGTDSPANFIQ